MQQPCDTSIRGVACFPCRCVWGAHHWRIIFCCRAQISSTWNTLSNGSKLTQMPEAMRALVYNRRNSGLRTQIRLAVTITHHPRGQRRCAAWHNLLQVRSVIHSAISDFVSKSKYNLVGIRFVTINVQFVLKTWTKLRKFSLLDFCFATPIKQSNNTSRLLNIQTKTKKTDVLSGCHPKLELKCLEKLVFFF